MTYYVIEHNNTTHAKIEKPMTYYDWFTRHEKGNPTGEAYFDYEDISQTDEAAMFIKQALQEGKEVQAVDGWNERVNIIGIEGR